MEPISRRLQIWLWRALWPLRARLHPGVEVGGCFPDFTLKDVDGKSHSLYDGKPGGLTVLWLTNLCDDCRARIPLLEEARRESGGRLRVLAVSILDINDPLPPKVARNCGFPILLDPDDIVARRLGQTHPPGTCPLRNLYVVDGAGRIRFKHHLSAVRPAEFRAALGALSKERS
ncbi:MAG: TlpA family protein disulfide reductase [Elusimicrobia bacterium]|nr:TlpA family protein disulfide reductase [Elusimicrobiota bacterium]